MDDLLDNQVPVLHEVGYCAYFDDQALPDDMVFRICGHEFPIGENVWALKGIILQARPEGYAVWLIAEPRDAPRDLELMLSRTRVGMVTPAEGRAIFRELKARGLEIEHMSLQCGYFAPSVYTQADFDKADDKYGRGEIFGNDVYRDVGPKEWEALTNPMTKAAM